MRTNIIEAIMGAVVLAIAAFFIGFVYTTSDEVDSHAFILKAKFDRVDGLLIGNDIRLSGVKVGSVKSLTISPESFDVEVTLSLKGDYKIPTDSAAEILSESLLGGKYVAIVPGGDQELLKSGDEITQTQSAVSWESLITKYFLNSDKKEGSEKNKDPEPAPKAEVKESMPKESSPEASASKESVTDPVAPNKIKEIICEPLTHDPQPHTDAPSDPHTDVNQNVDQHHDIPEQKKEEETQVNPSSSSNPFSALEEQSGNETEAQS